MGKLLNIKYGGLHGTYWMYYGIATSFASVLLLARGYSNGEIGIILAVANVAAVFLQPLVADFADRSKKRFRVSLKECVKRVLWYMAH